MSLLDNIKNREVLSEKVKLGWDSYIGYVKDNNLYTVKDITVADSEKFSGDLRGLFNNLGISNEYHYPNMILNGYLTFDGYKGEYSSLKIADAATLKGILSKLTR